MKLWKLMLWWENPREWIIRINQLWEHISLCKKLLKSLSNKKLYKSHNFYETKLRSQDNKLTIEQSVWIPQLNSKNV